MSDTPQNLHKKFLGFFGEQRAVKLLKKKRYKIIEKNYKDKIGEVDIIAEKQGFLIFIEVKTRVSDDFGRPAEAVTVAKQRKYRLMAMGYVNRFGYEDTPIRFDVIEILGKEINHIENAF